MKEIFSKINPDILIHKVHKKEDFLMQEERGNNLSLDKEALQVRALKCSIGEIFKEHKHLPQKRETNLTQESLIVIKGSIKVTCYDLNDDFLEELILAPGDCLITFNGGHRFEILEENTSFYEHKNGPYNGLVKDKKLLREEKDV